MLRHLITGHRLRHVVALLTAPAWLPTLLVPPTRFTAERCLVWLAAVGMDGRAFAAAARGFAARHTGAEGGRASTVALARARRSSRETISRGRRPVGPLRGAQAFRASMGPPP